MVSHVFQALSLHEHRQAYAPAILVQGKDGKRAGQVLRQVWFAGSHTGAYTFSCASFPRGSHLTRPQTSEAGTPSTTLRSFRCTDSSHRFRSTSRLTATFSSGTQRMVRQLRLGALLRLTVCLFMFCSRPQADFLSSDSSPTRRASARPSLSHADFSASPVDEPVPASFDPPARPAASASQATPRAGRSDHAG